ncbi:MAG: hypothetical protein AAGA87_08970 [Pseudomonadota bacterium]
MADQLLALVPIARAAFEVAAKELSALQEADAGLRREVDEVSRVPAVASGADLAVSARYVAWQRGRVRELQMQRAGLAVEIDVARAATARAFGRWQVLEELSLGVRPRR